MHGHLSSSSSQTQTSREVSKDQCGSNSFQRRCRCSGIATQLQTGTTTCVDDHIQPPLKRQCLRDTSIPDMHSGHRYN
ncbi:hypothetical protein Tco_0525322 [Tanacetum coccineum]